MTNTAAANAERPSRDVLPKVPTHIEGLDQILEGGLPQGRLTLVRGEPGSGKTVLGMEFLYRGALAGEPGIFIGFEESPEALRLNCATMGWGLKALEEENRLLLVGAAPPLGAVFNGEFSLNGILGVVAGKAREMGARRVVIDALDVLLRLHARPKEVRAEIATLDEWLREHELTALLTLKPMAYERRAHVSLDFFDSLVDCVLSLEARVSEQVTTRRVRVVKYRGSGFGRNEYPYAITEDGLHFAPISTVGLLHQPLGEKITTGIPRLDELLHGGFRRGASALAAGPPGSGKTLLFTTFASAACARGERVLYNSFEESAEALTDNVRSASVELAPHVESGRLRFLTAMPEAMGAEEHLIRFLRVCREFAPDHVVVDAISACPRMGSRQAAFEYLMRLLNHCKERGQTVLMVNQTSGDKERLEISGNGISSMIDTVLFLHYSEHAGETNRLMQVLKSRGSSHSNQRREFVITDHGLDLLPPYLGEGEVLTGTARQIREARESAEAESLAARVAALESEIESLRAIHDAETANRNALLEARQVELDGLRLQQSQREADRRHRCELRGGSPQTKEVPEG